MESTLVRPSAFEAQSELNRQAIVNKWLDSDAGPLDQAAGEYENAFVYRPYFEPGEPRQLIAQIALKIPVNPLPNITEELR